MLFLILFLSLVTLAQSQTTTRSSNNGQNGVKELTNRVQLLEESLSKLQDKTDEYEKTSSASLTKIKGQQEAAFTLLEKLETKQNYLTSAMTVLQTKHDSQEVSFTEGQTTLQLQLNSTAQELTAAKEEIRGLKVDIRNCQKKTNVKYLVQLVNKLYDNSTTLIFDTVKINDGNGYNSTTGVFTAPLSGTYLLWANILIEGLDEGMDIYLQQNDVELVKCTAHPGKGVYDTAAITYIADLQSGDRLFYRRTHWKGNIMFGEKYSFLGGVLLYRS